MKRNKYKNIIWAITILAFTAFYTTNGYADTFTGDTSRSTEGLGDYIAQFTYSLFSPTAAELTVSLTNTSPSSNGGFLTGFVFNNPNNFITNVNLSGSNPFFALLGGSSFQDTISASPLGMYDIGASLGGNFLGGGSPTRGIPVGGTASFGFTMTGNNLDQLNTGSFIQTKSSEGEFFVARFKGFNDGGSDKVPGGATSVPEPDIFILLLSGFAGLVIYREKLTKLCNVKMPGNKMA
jgi:hypothetical protein